jgi:hypothetical protein
MFFLKRISPFLIALVNVVVLEVLIKQPQLVWWLGFFLCFFNLLCLWLLIQKSLGFKAGFPFLITYLLLSIGLLLSLLFIELSFVKQAFIFLVALLFFLYQENLFRFLYLPEKYKAFSLENLNNTVNILTFLFLTIANFAAITYFDLKLGWALLLAFLLVTISLILFLRAVKIPIRGQGRYFGAVSLLLVEIFVLLVWLPFNFYLKALLFTTLYYLMSHIAKDVILGALNKKHLLWLLIVSLSIWLVLFVTARWT